MIYVGSLLHIPENDLINENSSFHFIWNYHERIRMIRKQENSGTSIGLVDIEPNLKALKT